jgi:hypothetical protein
MTTCSGSGPGLKLACQLKNCLTVWISNLGATRRMAVVRESIETGQTHPAQVRHRLDPQRGSMRWHSRQRQRLSRHAPAGVAIKSWAQEEPEGSVGEEEAPCAGWASAKEKQAHEVGSPSFDLIVIVRSRLSWCASSAIGELAASTTHHNYS